MKRRFHEPLLDDVRLMASVPAAMVECVDDMARARGVTRSEILRRLIAAGIVEDGPAVWDRLRVRDRQAIETLADMAGG